MGYKTNVLLGLFVAFWAVSAQAQQINQLSTDATVPLPNGTCFIVDQTVGGGFQTAKLCGNYATAIGAAGIGATGLTSVGLSVLSGSIFSVPNSPLTANGVLNLYTTGNSGGVPYFASSTLLSSSPTLGLGLPLFGGGVGNPPIPGATSGNTQTVVTQGAGSKIVGHALVYDMFGNAVDGGTGGGGGAGTVGSGIGPQIAQYPAGTSTSVSGVNISGDATLAQGGALTVAAGAITSVKLGAGAAAANIGSLGGDLAGSTLPNPTIANNAITTPKIGASQVTYANIQNVTAGRLLGNPGTSASAPVEITPGTGLAFSGTVLNNTATSTPGGSANSIQTNNGSGGFGGIGPIANAVAITNAAGVPSESTTLPTGLTVPTATITSPAISGGTIVSLPNPTNPQDVATKAYVDSSSTAGVSHPAVAAASTAALSGTWTYSNGTAGVGATLTAPAGTTTLTLDTYVVNNGDRVLIKDQGANAPQNGPYIATISGSPVVLTRATDMNQAAAGSMALGGFMNVTGGSAGGNLNSQWGLGAPTPAAITMGTTALTFNKLLSPTNYTADGTSLKLTGNVFSANLTPPAAGGTGVANTNTITLGGNLSTGGAFATAGGFGLTLTETGATNVTLPVSGTLLANARLINTSAPLTGGGDLSADRTLALSGPSNLTTFTANAIPKGAGTSAFAASSLTDNGTTVSTSEALSAAAGSFSGSLTTNITGSTQCIHALSTGVLAGMGAGLDCGSGTVNVGTALQAAYYATSASAVSGNPNVSYQSGFTRLNYMTTPGVIPTPVAGTGFQLSGPDSTTNPTALEIDAFGGPAKTQEVCYGGTSGSLATIGSGVVCGGLHAFAYNGSSVIGPLGGIRMVTTQAQASGAAGMQTAVQSVPNNSTIPQDTLVAGQDGSLTVLNQAGTGTRCVHVDSTGKQSPTTADCVTGTGADTVSAAVTAAGSNQSGCTNLTSQQNKVTTVASGTGVCLPAPTVGGHVYVCDQGLNDLTAYAPAGGAVINQLAATAGFGPIAANSCALFVSMTTTAWNSVP